jgi:acyl-CoA thioester hydrolase
MYRPIETFRGAVYPWSIDHMGHMNVQFYTARFDEASWQFLARLGLSPSYLRANWHGTVAVDARTQYLRELVAGSLLHVTTQLLELGRSSIRFVHRMYDSETNEEVATTEYVGVYIDAVRRTSVELPEHVRESAATLLDPHGLVLERHVRRA